MKLGAVCGYVGVIQALGYALLQKYGLIDLLPVLDSILQVACPIGGAVGAVALHLAPPPGSDA
jgi:hypothetical protein